MAEEEIKTSPETAEAAPEAETAKTKNRNAAKRKTKPKP